MRKIVLFSDCYAVCKIVLFSDCYAVCKIVLFSDCYAVRKIDHINSTLNYVGKHESRITN